jgi:hypothetical protein
LQFGDFLKGAMAPADYARLLPPLESLVRDYGMDPVRYVVNLAVAEQPQ